jgi:5-methylcytosine-specific restriction endonuclease McrA
MTIEDGWGYGTIYQRASDRRWVAAVCLPRRREGEPRRRKTFTALDRETVEAKLAAYRADNPSHGVSDGGATRAERMERAKALGTHTSQEWWAHVRAVLCTCEYCGDDLGYRRDMTQDHRTPVCRGGSDAIDNLAVACARCNMEKNIMTEDEYAQWKADR